MLMDTAVRLKSKSWVKCMASMVLRCDTRSSSDHRLCSFLRVSCVDENGAQVGKSAAVLELMQPRAELVILGRRRALQHGLFEDKLRRPSGSGC